MAPEEQLWDCADVRGIRLLTRMFAASGLSRWLHGPADLRCDFCFLLRWDLGGSRNRTIDLGDGTKLTRQGKRSLPAVQRASTFALSSPPK
jgi:hypothetical protein